MDDGPKVYFRRHLILLSYAITVFAWNLSGLRYTSIVSSYALYHDIPNEVSAPPFFGVDSFSLISNIMLVFTSLFGAYIIDRWGLKTMTLGSFVLALVSWLWYFSGTNQVLVILCKALAAIFGSILTASILAITNRWYPPRERAKATAFGSLVSVIGGAGALLIPPLFATQKDYVVELALRSCKVSELDLNIKNAFNNAKVLGEQLLCTGENASASDKFCCYLPVDIPKLNMAMAIVSTTAFVFTALCVKDLPPNPPAASGEKKKFISLWAGIKQVYSTQHLIKLSLSDFLVSGPVVLAYYAISRIFPSSVKKYAFLVSALGTLLAIPASIIVGHVLDKTKWYYSLTFGGYCSGTIAWAISTVCLASGTLAGAYVFMITLAISLMAYISWQTAVFEAKMEYAFSPDVSLEGTIVGTDRSILNLSALIFLAAIPPERVRGANNMFYIGLAVMVLGCIPTFLIRNKYDYKRLAYDTEKENE